MTIDMSQFYQIYFDEAQELLAEMEKYLLGIDINNPDTEDLNAIFRAAHSIKGAAGTFGVNDMAEITHVLENLLDKIRKGEIPLTQEYVDAFLSSKDVLKMQLEGHKYGHVVDQERVADMSMMLQNLVSNASAVTKSEDKSVLNQSKAHTLSMTQAEYHSYQIIFPTPKEDVESLLFAELRNSGEIKSQIKENGKTTIQFRTHFSEEDLASIFAFVMNVEHLEIMRDGQVLEQTQTPIEDDLGYGFFEPLDQMFSDLPIVSSNATQDIPDSHNILTLKSDEHRTIVKREPDKAHAQESTIRVGVEKVDQIINLIGELVITQAMLSQRSENIDPVQHSQLLNCVALLSRNTRDLQQAVMSIRMMPMDYVFSRFPRMVRDLANKLGKKIELITLGSSTELDKGLIERIVDPLTHLVRNSIDHGIETPETRKARGKHEVGHLTLSAAHQGGNIVIEVSDDGGGLNRERILAKAIENGLPASENMTDNEVWQLIFEPGFSTAETVTDVSGRGVGMDVVKRNITQMGGVVDIKSSRGFGSTITISLPLTLAILDGMSVRVGDEIYILPLSFVMESLQPKDDDIKEVNGKGTLIRIRNEYLPLIYLYKTFSIHPKHIAPSKGILVIIEVDGKKAALFVDELVGQQQVVVKNIESNYKKVSGVSGATILGDGSVSFILDVSSLLRTVL